jgi:cobalt/nickel transport system ATP-binding protein
MQPEQQICKTVFSVNDVSYSYNEQIMALDHVSIAVKKGERLAILGSNGSGKSTLLKILDGLYYPTGGSVQVFGHDLTEEALRDERFNFEFRSRVGFVFQDSDVQLFMPSVWDEVVFAPLQLNLPAEQVTQRVDDALQELDLLRLKDRAPHQLSGGEKKRVALASVLSLQPEVWLLDEPSAGLDPRSVDWLINFLNTQGQAGKTVVVATHDLNIVESAADRVYVLDENHHLIAEDTPAQILADRQLLLYNNLVRK